MILILTFIKISLTIKITNKKTKNGSKLNCSTHLNIFFGKNAQKTTLTPKKMLDFGEHV